LTKEQLEKPYSFKCSNVSCNRVFAKPLKTLDVKLSPETLYDACPYCLTRVAKSDEEGDEEAEAEVPQPREEEKPLQPSSCSYHLGYLSERDSKAGIPDGCMVCQDIVACMLRKIKR
jgi:hypothetical protein